MASKFRVAVSNQVGEILSSFVDKCHIPRLTKSVNRALKFGKKKGTKPQLLLDVTDLKKTGIEFSSGLSNESLLKSLTIKGCFSDLIKDISFYDEKKRFISFSLDSVTLTKEVLDSYLHDERYPWKNSSLFKEHTKEKIIIEYSSPNIAKPFHVGHLRSTIIGNVIGNIMEALGHSVTRINFLGDWGTQFGLLKVGYDKYGDDNRLKEDPMSHLYDVYVKINKAISDQPNLLDEAKANFQSMESGDKDLLKKWNMFRQLSIDEYHKMYKRLGVTFDHYHGESMYGKQLVNELLEELRDTNVLLHEEETNLQVVKLKNDKRCTLVKSDGSTLYLTRDIAAAIHRKKLFDFDKMLYVVEKGQSDHFQSLFEVVNAMGHQWSRNMQHVTFGRVHGMSTRKGEVVFLKDIMEEAKIRAYDSMNASTTTKVDVKEREEIADILGVGAIIVNDLKAARNSDYSFVWEKALHQKGDSGISLQYTHARLENLEKNYNAQIEVDVDVNLLQDHDSLNLIQILARYDEAIMSASDNLEPCAVVQYLFQLSHAINLAYRNLQVKNVDARTAQARLRLFNTSKKALSSGLRLIGLCPLAKI